MFVRFFNSGKYTDQSSEDSETSKTTLLPDRADQFHLADHLTGCMTVCPREGNFAGRQLTFLFTPALINSKEENAVSKCPEINPPQRFLGW